MVRTLRIALKCLKGNILLISFSLFIFLVNHSVLWLPQLADVWSCGVILYTMLVGTFPFEDQEDRHNFKKTMNVIFSFFLTISIGRCIMCLLFLTSYYFFQRIMAVQYKIPNDAQISEDCKNLLSRIFVANPAKVCISRAMVLNCGYGN